ncbi:MAG TPA: hypothetical protein VG248_00095 [Caulobacteraceae bacterium]|jgi:hypothetical protein|nr:hypothetical protein [Caulobacteraceae bacterium]
MKRRIIAQISGARSHSTAAPAAGSRPLAEGLAAWGRGEQLRVYQTINKGWSKPVGASLEAGEGDRAVLSRGFALRRGGSIAVALLSLIAVSGGVIAEPVPWRMNTIDSPPLNATAEAKVGDVILQKGRAMMLAALSFQSPLVFKAGLSKYVVPPGQLTAIEQDAKFTYFSADQVLESYTVINTPPKVMPGGVCVARSGPQDPRLFIILGACGFKFNGRPVVEFVDVRAAEFKQDIVYDGRSGSTIKFTYREFGHDLDKPTVSQDIRYDLKDGPTIDVKGARIDVIDATDAKISYRVSSSFPVRVN